MVRAAWRCEGPEAGFPGYCDGPLEVDHIRAGGMGLRSRSSLDNLAALCRHHHRWKTEHGRQARPLLIALPGRA